MQWPLRSRKRGGVRKQNKQWSGTNKKKRTERHNKQQQQRKCPSGRLGKSDLCDWLLRHAAAQLRGRNTVSPERSEESWTRPAKPPFYLLIFTPVNTLTVRGQLPFSVSLGGPSRGSDDLTMASLSPSANIPEMTLTLHPSAVPPPLSLSLFHLA